MMGSMLVVFSLSTYMQSERDRFAFSKQELERAVSEMTAHIEELQKKHDEKEEKYHHMEVYPNS